MNNDAMADKWKVAGNPFVERADVLFLYLTDRFKFFQIALETLYRDIPYGDSLYRFIAEKENDKYSTVASSFQTLPIRAKQYEPSLYASIAGTTSFITPLAFLKKSAYWLKASRRPLPFSSKS